MHVDYVSECRCILVHANQCKCMQVNANVLYFVHIYMWCYMLLVPYISNCRRQIISITREGVGGNNMVVRVRSFALPYFLHCRLLSRLWTTAVVSKRFCLMSQLGFNPVLFVFDKVSLFFNEKFQPRKRIRKRAIGGPAHAN